MAATYKILATALCLGMLGGAIVLPVDALAKDKGRSPITWDKGVDKGETNIDVRISLGDRTIIRDYLEKDYRAHCPPGLAKKHNGCLPPGQAKKYRVGYPLARDVTIADLPDILLGRLRPLPRGYYYGRIDDDVVVVSRENRMIVDAVSLLLGQ